MTNTEKITTRTINKCIYCGSNGPELTDEHVIPYALNGQYILKKASCPQCQKITSAFESNILKHNWGDFRKGVGFNTRNKRKKNEIGVQIKDKNGEEKTLFLPKEKQIVYIILPEYEVPGYILDKNNTGIKVVGTTHFSRCPNMSVKEFIEKYDISEFIFSSTYSYSDLPRLLMKIAYGMAVFQYGYDCFEENYVLPYILDKDKPGLGDFVGTSKNKSIPVQPGPIVVKLGFLEKNGAFISKIKLLPEERKNEDTTPEYIVVLGLLKEEFLPKLEWN